MIRVCNALIKIVVKKKTYARRFFDERVYVEKKELY